jgi:hypothetical protein
MKKRLIFNFLLSHAGNEFSVLELSDAAEVFVEIANDNFEPSAPNHKDYQARPQYHALPVDNAMSDGGWRVLGVETQIGNASNDEIVFAQKMSSTKRKIGRVT